MKLLDLFCKAGGTSMGFHRAGFNVTGVDIEPQPRYPFKFVQADALEFCSRYGRKFDLIAASPPWPLYSITAALSNNNHPDLVEITRKVLISTGRPYIIENVPDAPLINPLMLCGTMFPELRVIRHRLFECCPIIWFPPAPCQHTGKSTGAAVGMRRRGKFPHSRTARLSDGFKYVTITGNDYIAADARRAMGIDWMTKAELSQAIPPAYTEWLGKQMLELICQ